MKYYQFEQRMEQLGCFVEEAKNIQGETYAILVYYPKFSKIRAAAEVSAIQPGRFKVNFEQQQLFQACQMLAGTQIEMRY